MIARNIQATVFETLQWMPAVVVLGARQVGKTTLAQSIGQSMDSVYLDLENPSDLRKLDDPQFYFEQHKGRLIIIDEVQCKPELFQVLRSQIDSNQKQGVNNGQFLLLGSASNLLLNQSAESLAGRVCYLELPSLNVLEVGNAQMHELWLKGGFPSAFIHDKNSIQWRKNFIRTYLERDIPQLGIRVPAETLRRFWTMLAHHQGQCFNAAEISRGLGLSKGQSSSYYLDIMVDLMLVRRLKPYATNIGKRLVKSPKTYIRDSGILHALLDLPSMEILLGHPVIGASWEGFVIENILSVVSPETESYFYRTSAGAEIDLLLIQGNQSIAIEIKRSTAPVLSKGFYQACSDLLPHEKWVIYPGEESYKMKDDITVVSLFQFLKRLQSG